MIRKKGFITTPLIDFWSIVAFMLVAIVVFFIIKAEVERNELIIKDEAQSSDVNKILHNYLRTEVDVDGKRITISELIMLSNYDVSYMKILSEKTDDIFKRFVENSRYNCYNIYSPDIAGLSFEGRDKNFKFGCFSSGKNFVEAALPTKERKIKIELALE